MRFIGANSRALLKAHVGEEHRQEHVSKPDAINVATPAFRPMTDVLWEKVDRLMARVKQLELITAVAWGVVQGLAIWALIGAAIAVVIVAIRLVLAAG